jgi:ubiquinone/menaquinone biosynthesis C-methylase UbiE
MNTNTSKRRVLRALLAAPILFSGSCDRIKARFYIDHMEREERLGIIQVERVVESLHLAPGSRIADIGAGSGLFTRALAKKADRGAVYAVDINSGLLEHIAQTAREQDLANIHTVLAREDDPRLPEPVDLVFICDTLHYIDNPERYVGNLSSRVVEGGRVAIVDFFRNWPPMSDEFSREQLESWMSRAGFVLVEEHDFLEDRYFLIFERRVAA